MKCPSCGAVLPESAAPLQGLYSCAACGAEFEPGTAPRPAAPPRAEAKLEPAPPTPHAPRAVTPRPERFLVEEAPGELRIGWSWSLPEDSGILGGFAVPISILATLGLLVGLSMLPVPIWVPAGLGVALAPMLYLLGAHRIGRTRIAVRGRALEARFGPLPFPGFTGARRIDQVRSVFVTPAGLNPAIAQTFSHEVWADGARGERERLASFVDPGHAQWLKETLERRLGL